jgi:hypothetical protein
VVGIFLGGEMLIAKLVIAERISMANLSRLVRSKSKRSFLLSR